MTALTVQLPESLHKEMKSLVEIEGISMNQFLTLAVAEKISALRTVEYLRREGMIGSRIDFDVFLAAVPDVEPDLDDRIE